MVFHKQSSGLLHLHSNNNAHKKNNNMSVRPLIKKIMLVFSLILSTASVFGAYKKNISPSDTPAATWVMNHANACLLEDNTHRIAANGECLAIQTYTDLKQLPKPNERLVIYIHGDGIPGGGPSDYLKYQATKHILPDTVNVVVMRPGYYDSYDQYSTGESHAFDCNGYPCDGYDERTVTTLAASIQKLKSYYQPRCTILVGHSGGAIMSAIMLGKYPTLANGAVLASTTFNVKEWAAKHHWNNWSNSLSPDNWIDKIPRPIDIYVIAGEKDTDTYPDLAHKYFSALQRTDHKSIHWLSVPHGSHDSIVLDEAKNFNWAIDHAISNCPAN